MLIFTDAEVSDCSISDAVETLSAPDPVELTLARETRSCEDLMMMPSSMVSYQCPSIYELLRSAKCLEC